MEDELIAFIDKNKLLFWYTPEEKKKNISENLLVETILNYGSLDDVKELINIMGKERISEVFFNAKERQKLNYFPEIYNYFKHLFNRYAQEDS